MTRSSLPTVRGADLPPLGWQHTEPLDVATVGPIVDIKFIKPKGGLWTSPLRYDGDRLTGTGWTDWCNSEEFGNPSAPITLIHPNPDAAVYLIDTAEDLKALEQAYWQPSDYPISMFPQLSWEAVAADFDAIWLTDGGQWATRFSTPGLYGWDCETVFWLRPVFTVGETVELPATSDAED